MRLASGMVLRRTRVHCKCRRLRTSRQPNVHRLGYSRFVWPFFEHQASRCRLRWSNHVLTIIKAKLTRWSTSPSESNGSIGFLVTPNRATMGGVLSENRRLPRHHGQNGLPRNNSSTKRQLGTLCSLWWNSTFESPDRAISNMLVWNQKNPTGMRIT